MTVEKTFQGAIRIRDGAISRQYFGYSKAEARRMFKRELKQLSRS